MSNIRILIVEDERIIALDLREKIVNLGYEVVASVATGEDAVTSAGRLRPDLVVMDIHLAGAMDGTAAARRIHEETGIPVLFLTAYASEDTLDRALASRPFGYLVKPVGARELQAAILTALTRRVAEYELEQAHERTAQALAAAGLGVVDWVRRDRIGGRRIGADTVIVERGAPLKRELLCVFDRLAPEVRDDLERWVDAAAAEPGPVTGVFRGVTEGSSTSWFELTGRFEHDREARGVRFRGVIKELIERAVA